MKAANCGIKKLNRIVPVMLKIAWAAAVRFALRFCPIEARMAVIVVPMLSPSRIGIAPVSPMTLVVVPATAVDAKLCSTAIVADEDCTRSVMHMPRRIPRNGTSLTLPMRSVNTALWARGFMTELMISMPSKRRPNEKITWPMSLTRSFFPRKFTRNPMKMIG